jgi:predicted component of type VI protein secretion system
MGVKKIAKIVSLIALILLATSCLEKTNNLSTENMDVANKLWQWDDVKKSWLYNGSVFSTKTSPVLPASAWKKQANAIFLRVESLKSLNAFDNAPKALQMKVFQLSDSKAFLQAAKSSSGLKHLLVTEQIDPAVLGMERLIVLPGVSQSVSLDRLEGARYLGIVLGYASLKQEKIFRLIPIVALDDGNNTLLLPAALTSNETKLQNAKAVALSSRPAVLKINLFLEANGINKLDVDAI